MYSQILVPLDGSENSRSALKTAIQISRYFGSTITLMSVVNQSGMAIASGSIPYDLSGEFRKQAQGILTEGQKLTEEAGVQTKTIITEGIPKNEIVSAADKEGIDLIVMGKSGADAINRLLIGSTTAYVVRQANVQVLVVNAQEKDE
ncbi:universal stress protein [Secundilactobacillus folii]|uniref:Universal stress protein n=1 Tax=Secundilactobacillus folii TaxID=2678357 RepID=A0A7X3C2C1_9LACO|nr:universal stress protein [Secundilactobacillus folii]MTV81317.1 universal stress protein [Secundilactobacillus folii]